MTTTIAPGITTHATTTSTTTPTGTATVSSFRPAANTPVDAGALTPLTWANVTEGLWVASRAGDFSGTVEFVDGRFEAADERGARLGRSHSLAGAKRLLDQPSAVETENVLGWTGDRTVIALGWLAFGVSAIAAASIASQLFL